MVSTKHEYSGDLFIDSILLIWCARDEWNFCEQFLQLLFIQKDEFLITFHYLNSTQDD